MRLGDRVAALEAARAERALREALEFNRSILAASSDCIKILDLDGRLLSMSAGGRRALRLAEGQDLAGRPWVECWAEAERPKVASAVAAARAGGVLPSRSNIARTASITGSPAAGARGAGAEASRSAIASPSVSPIGHSAAWARRRLRSINPCRRQSNDPSR